VLMNGRGVARTISIGRGFRKEKVQPDATHYRSLWRSFRTR
jgi:hypothetical protein